MTRTSLSQHPNLSQDSLPKKRKFCYLNELPASKELYEKLKHSKKKNHRRQAKIVDIINHFLQKGKGICYTQTKKWVELLKNEEFKACKETIQNDFNKLEELGLIWRNSWTRPKHGGSGSVRHLITCWNLHRYETEYIEALNKKGLGKPDETKTEFYQYKERVMKENFPKHNAFLLKKKSKKISRQKITTPSEETFLTENNSPLYVFKNYIYISPHAKIARKRTKKRGRKREATVPETKKPKYPENAAQNQKLWDPERLNDPEWVIQEAIHQGCDGLLAKQIVDAIQIKQIPLKTNLLRATLHVAKSKKKDYIHAITTPTAATEIERERKYSNGLHDVFASGSGNYLTFSDHTSFRNSLKSKNFRILRQQYREKRLEDLRCYRASLRSN